MAKIAGLDSASIFVEDAAGTVDFIVSQLGFAVEELAHQGAERWRMSDIS